MLFVVHLSQHLDIYDFQNFTKFKQTLLEPFLIKRVI